MEELKKPTPELVWQYLKKVEDSTIDPRSNYDENNYPAINKAELAIKNLISLFPSHDKIEDVYIKATAINSLYSTNIYDTYKIAYHIFKIEDIDKYLKLGDITLISKIAKGHKIPNEESEKNFYSFATKYCSFHNPESYPIYDGLIQSLLIEYSNSKIEGLKFSSTGLNYEYLRRYDKFKETIEEFRSYFGLTEFGLKKIDLFLWLYAKDREREKIRNKVSKIHRQIL